jgi:hypothetical protein
VTLRESASRRLRAALCFAQLEPRAPELRLLHRWLDTWSGLGATATGMARKESGAQTVR